MEPIVRSMIHPLDGMMQGLPSRVVPVAKRGREAAPRDVRRRGNKWRPRLEGFLCGTMLTATLYMMASPCVGEMYRRSTAVYGVKAGRIASVYPGEEIMLESSGVLEDSYENVSLANNFQESANFTLVESGLAVKLNPLLYNHSLAFAPDVDWPDISKVRTCLFSPNYHHLESGFINGVKGVLHRDHRKFQSKWGACNVYISSFDEMKTIKRMPSSLLANALGTRTCLGGSKGVQLTCRRKLATTYGCKFDDYMINPLTFDLGSVRECRLFRLMQRNQPEKFQKLWWLKKSTSNSTGHGKGLQLFDPPAMEKFLKGKWPSVSCEAPYPALMTQYMHNPARVAQHKFDVRTYMVIARTNPVLVFYHSGVVRVSNRHFNLKNMDRKVHFTNVDTQNERSVSGERHILNFKELSRKLAQGQEWPEDWMSDKFQKVAAKASNYVLQSMLKDPGFDKSKMARRFQVYGLDWVISRNGKIQLLESNSWPNIRGEPLGTRIWTDLAKIITYAHREPHKLVTGTERLYVPNMKRTAAEKEKLQALREELDRNRIFNQEDGLEVPNWDLLTVQRNYAFGKWKLIYNQAEGTLQSPCELLDAIEAEQKDNMEELHAFRIQYGPKKWRTAVFDAQDELPLGRSAFSSPDDLH